MIFVQLLCFISLFVFLLGDPGPHPQGRNSKVCKNPLGEKGDVVYDDCTKMECVKKGKKMKWLKSSAKDSCCSYEGDLYPADGGQIAKLWSTDNGTQVILSCAAGPAGPSIQVTVENCQTSGNQTGAPATTAAPAPSPSPATTTTIYDGVLIVGGRNSGGYLSSAEEFNPETRHSCAVEDIPKASHYGSLCNNMYCGGNGGYKSCVRYHGNGTFTQLPVTLVKSRYKHICWGLPSGEVILMGGGGSSSKTTERVSADGSSSSPDFNLPYDTYKACGIDLGDTYVVTGGYVSSSPSKLVTSYDQSGKFTYLPNLRYKRRVHACSHFINANGDTTLLVTGGYGTSSILSSTEILVLSSSAWSRVASLPSARSQFPAVNVNNAIYVFGGYHYSSSSGSKLYDDIYRYDHVRNSWLDPAGHRAGKMQVVRRGLSASPSEDVEKFCS